MPPTPVDQGNNFIILFIAVFPYLSLLFFFTGQYKQWHEFIMASNVSKKSAPQIAVKIANAINHPKDLWELISKKNDTQQNEDISHYIPDPLARESFLSHLQRTFGSKEDDEEKTGNLVTFIVFYYIELIL